MKKIIFAVVCVLAIGMSLTSCDKDKSRCFKETYTLPNGSTAVVYRWSTINLMETEKTRLESVGYTEVKYSYATKYKTSTDCIAQNVQ